MKDRRGISGVITTILLVLLVLAAVLIVWGFVRTTISDNIEQGQAKLACLSLNLEPVRCQITTPLAGIVNASYKRGAGAGDLDLSGVKLIFTLADGSSEVTDADADNIPGELETKLQSPVSPAFASANLPETFTVAGVFTDEEGNPTTCDPSPIVVNCN